MAFVRTETTRPLDPLRACFQVRGFDGRAGEMIIGRSGPDVRLRRVGSQILSAALGRRPRRFGGASPPGGEREDSRRNAI